MNKRRFALVLCLILALSLLTACGSTEISGKSEPKGGTDSSSKALQSLTYELHTEGQLHSGYTIRYDENGLAEALDYISDGKTESAPVDYTFDDKGSPVSVSFSTENATFSAEFSIEYGATTTVSVVSCTFNNEMFTDFSDSSRTAPIMTSFLLFRLIDQFDGFRNATLSVPGTDIEQRVEDGETVYSSTAYNDFSTTTELRHEAGGGSTSVTTMVMGDDQIVTTIQSDADNRPTRYAIVNTDGSQISFDIHYSDPVDGEALGHPANIETKGFSSALSAEDIKTLEAMTIYKCTYENGRLCRLDQYTLSADNDLDAPGSSTYYDAQGRIIRQESNHPQTGELMQRTLYTYR